MNRKELNFEFSVSVMCSGVSVISLITKTVDGISVIVTLKAEPPKQNTLVHYERTCEVVLSSKNVLYLLHLLSYTLLNYTLF